MLDQLLVGQFFFTYRKSVYFIQLKSINCKHYKNTFLNIIICELIIVCKYTD